MNKYLYALLEVVVGAVLGIVIGLSIHGCDAHAQGYENVCICYRVPGCWMIAEYTRDGQPGDGEWEWLPLWSEMLRYNVRTFGAGWSCSHGMGG